MRIIRAVTDDGSIIVGDDRGDDTATVLRDPRGVITSQPIQPAPHPESAQSPRELLQGRRALIAEDDENMRTTLRTVLEKYGCTCTACADGAEAIEILHRHDTIDLVVSDIAMPGADGYEVFSVARNTRRTMPVVLITGFGYDPGHALVRASKEGLSAVLYKPFTPTKLLERVGWAIREAAIRESVPQRTEQASPIKKRLAPIVPRQIICIGRNYPPLNLRDGKDTFSSRTFEVFLKPLGAVIGLEEDIRPPRFDGVDPQLDCEGELAVVIGATARNVSEADALQYVLGYTTANDITARHWQTATGPPQWMRGKGFDTFCPIGPAVVTAEKIDDLSSLRIKTRINGKVVRDGAVSEMICPVAGIISELSARMTLPAGTVILTGAPPAGDHLDRSLKADDEVEVEIDSLGVLRNRISG